MHPSLTASKFEILQTFVILCFFYFRDDPPSQTTMVAGQELLRLLESNPDGLAYLDPIKDFNMKHLEVVENVKRINHLECMIASYQCIDCPQFVQHVCFQLDALSAYSSFYPFKFDHYSIPFPVPILPLISHTPTLSNFINFPHLSLLIGFFRPIQDISLIVVPIKFVHCRASYFFPPFNIPVFKRFLCRTNFPFIF